MADLRRRRELSGRCADQRVLPQGRRRSLWHAHDLHRRGTGRERARSGRAADLPGRDLLLRGRSAGRALRRQSLNGFEEMDMATSAQRKKRVFEEPARPDLAELKSRLLSVRAQIEPRALATEKACRVPAENIAALRAIGYFDIVKPARFGGYEHDFDVLVDLNIELAKSCASTAWVAGLLAAHQWLIASFPEAAQRDVWEENPDAVACGSYA